MFSSSDGKSDTAWGNDEVEARYLLVTANQHETDALLRDHNFFTFSPDQRSAREDDVLFYNIGRFGAYEVVHFELPEQGSSRADASFASVQAAIEAWKPDAVILIGIAFGKEAESKPEPRKQHIGDVLVSTQLIDYESGKKVPNGFDADGSRPDVGRHLLTTFKHYSRSWIHQIEQRQAEAQFGPILSGDKVVDDPIFKSELFAQYPRAIGGEMEARGAYGACRRQRIDELIVVKGICDWGENKQNLNKERDQIVAAQSAVSLVRHVFSDGESLKKIPPRWPTSGAGHNERPNFPAATPIGYCISVGTTSCRLFEISNAETMKEVAVATYQISDPEAREEYLESIAEAIVRELIPRMGADRSNLFQKVFVDSAFVDIFDSYQDPSVQKDFTRSFYEKSNLYFNVLTKGQTEENLKRLFPSLEESSAILNIGSAGVEILVHNHHAFRMHSLTLTLADVQNYVEAKNWGSSLTEKQIIEIKEYIRREVEDELRDVRASRAIIIKDELDFMRLLQYPLRLAGNDYFLTQKDYRNHNRDRLFAYDYEAWLRERFDDGTRIRRLLGFRYGHLLLETVVQLLGSTRIYPRDELSIHGGGATAYVFNVAISGRTHSGGEAHLIEAADMIVRMGANVTSPPISGGRLVEPISAETEYRHLKAIDECDVLFVCNRSEDGGVGETTKCEIYYAYALRKTIAFWREPKEDRRISFIPHEHWGAIKSFIA